MRTVRKLLVSVVLVIGLIVFPNVAGRVTASGPWYVATTGDDTNDCLSPATACKTVQAAINKAASGDTINVAAGTYPEAVNISQRENLRVVGVAGSAITNPGLPFGSAVVNVQLSKNIALEGLVISGNTNGVEAVRIFDSLAVSIRRCTIEQASEGFFINGQSSVVIEVSTIQDNSTGIRVDGSSSVSLNSTPFATGTSLVQRNNTGVLVRTGNFFLHGATVVQYNTGFGIFGDGGTIKACCGNGLRKINDNGQGIQLRGGSLDLRGPLEMEGNQFAAITQFGGFISISDRVVIRNNGDAGTAGVSVFGGHLRLVGRGPNDIEISNNPGHGVVLAENASARISNVLISNNGVHGLRVEAHSTARLFNNTILRDNGGFDLSCTPNSFGFGNDNGIGRKFCPGFEPFQGPLNPDPGGPNNP